MRSWSGRSWTDELRTGMRGIGGMVSEELVLVWGVEEERGIELMNRESNKRGRIVKWYWSGVMEFRINVFKKGRTRRWSIC